MIHPPSRGFQEVRKWALHAGGGVTLSWGSGKNLWSHNVQGVWTREYEQGGPGDCK